MEPTKLVHIVVGPGRRTWDLTDKIKKKHWKDENTNIPASSAMNNCFFFKHMMGIVVTWCWNTDKQVRILYGEAADESEMMSWGLQGMVGVLSGLCEECQQKRVFYVIVRGTARWKDVVRVLCGVIFTRTSMHVCMLWLLFCVTPCVCYFHIFNFLHQFNEVGDMSFLDF